MEIDLALVIGLVQALATTDLAPELETIDPARGSVTIGPVTDLELTMVFLVLETIDRVQVTAGRISGITAEILFRIDTTALTIACRIDRITVATDKVIVRINVVTGRMTARITVVTDRISVRTIVVTGRITVRTL